MRRPILLIVFVLALPLTAQHQISKIEFRSRIPAGILLTQSALAENRAYTDADLEVAVARLRRLPFVYSVRHTIDGSTLIVDVVDEYRGFIFVDIRLEGEGLRSGGNGFLAIEGGGRYYLPWSGVIKGSVGLLSERSTGGTTWSAEYSQYGVAGTRLFGTVALRRTSGAEGPQPDVVIGYPLTLRQTLSARANRFAVKESENFGSFTNESETTTAALGWRWDTTNDPLFATRGFSVDLEGGMVERENLAISRRTTTGDIIFLTDIVIEATTARAAAEGFYPLGRGAVTGGIAASLEQGDRDFRADLNAPFTRTEIETERTDAAIGYAYNFFGSLTELRRARHRVELAVGFTQVDSDLGVRTESADFNTVQLGYAVRSRVANIHVVLSYLSR